MLKKFILISLSCLLILSLVACGNDTSPKNDKEVVTQEEVEPSGEVPVEEDDNVPNIVGGAAIGVVEGVLNGTSVKESETTTIQTIVESLIEGVTSVVESQVIENIEDSNEVIVEDEAIFFNAYVLKVDDYSLIVEPFEDTPEFENSDKYCILPSSLYENENFKEFKKGDILEIVYNGLILESYPAKIYADEIYIVGTVDGENENVDDILDGNIGGHINDFIIDNETIVVKKPVIYLYPETPMDVEVNISFDGDFVFTYPVSPNGTWNVYAYPNGTLVNNNDGREYPYIFWEGTSNVDWDLSQGFVVKGEDTLEFLEEKLAYLGLNDREASEFISYWVPLMQDNEYNLITFQNELYTNNFNLEVYPRPDSTLRVFMVYKALDNPINIEEPTLVPFDRTGFSVIEWGGAEVK